MEVSIQRPDRGETRQHIDVELVLKTLDDGTCREILSVVETAPRTAREIADECELALSTTYRKLDILTDANLLEQQIRPRRRGKPAREYSLRFEDVVFSLPGTGLTVGVSFRSGATSTNGTTKEELADDD